MKFLIIFSLLLLSFFSLTVTDIHKDYAVDVIGHSEMGVPILAVYNISTTYLPSVLIVLNIHGDEQAGYAMGLRMLTQPMILPVHAIWIPTMNPDGVEYETRGNVDGLDLNRAFGDRCNRTQNTETAETRAIKKFIQKTEPMVLLSYHMGAAVVVWGPDQDCNSTSTQIKAPMSSFEETLDLHWATHYAHHWGKGDESRTIQGSAMYQLAGSMLEYAVPTYTEVGMIIEMDAHKHPNDILEEIIETQHREALLAVLADIGAEAVAEVPECLKNETLLAKARSWYLLPPDHC